jgi:hypothetical protein
MKQIATDEITMLLGAITIIRAARGRGASDLNPKRS